MGKRVTRRDQQLVELLGGLRAATHGQLHIGVFDTDWDSRSQARLTFLVRERWMDVQPRRLVNEPLIYVLSRRSLRGLAYLRERFGEQWLRDHLTRLGSLEHLLAINEVRVRVMRSCRAAGFALRFWQRAEELEQHLGSQGLIPDGYFQISRQSEGRLTHASFFLELQRANRSRLVMESKLRRYRELLTNGAYERVFGDRAVRLLVIFTPDSDLTPRTRVKTALAAAERLRLSRALFTSLDQLTDVSPNDFLTAAVWRRPGHTDPVPLFAS